MIRYDTERPLIHSQQFILPRQCSANLEFAPKWKMSDRDRLIGMESLSLSHTCELLSISQAMSRPSSASYGTPVVDNNAMC